MEPFAHEVLWILILGFIIAFILAFGIGANDVANSFGTSVGSGVLTIRQACVLATVCEISGSILIGYKVSDTMRKGILEVGLYEGAEEELMLGCLSALASSAAWLLAATFLKLPISGTHSIVGSTIGFSLVARGTNGLKWHTLFTIIGSWFISPVMSGCVSIVLFIGIRKFILRASEPLKAGFRSLPIFYGVTFFINVISVVLDGPKLLYLDNIPTLIAISASLIMSLIVALLTHVFIVPMQKRKIAKILRAKNPVKFNFDDSLESSPSGSPKKNRRPLSLVSEGKQLPAIAEITELVSLTDNSPKTFRIAPTGLGSNSTHDNYKINPEIIKKAEDLLGKASLDNTDLTITSLNFIDEQHQNGNATGIGNATGNGNAVVKDTGIVTATYNNDKKSTLQEYFKHTDNEQQGATPLTAGTVTAGVSIHHSNGLPKSQTEQQHNCSAPSITSTNNNNTATLITDGPIKKDLTVVESGTSLELMISTLSPNSSKVPLIENKEGVNEYKNTAAHNNEEESEEVSMLFSFLQVLTAIFGSFAHGGNDVSNAIGPLIALYIIYKEGSVMQKAESPIYILIYGGVGISIGLWLWGRRVIQTIGNDLTKITSPTGFTIEIGSAITVLLASKIGLPISTTHCKVGSVVFVGHVNSRVEKTANNGIASAGNGTVTNVDGGDKSSTTSTVKDNTEMTAETIATSTAATGTDVDITSAKQSGSVDWHLFRNIAYAWIVTVPVTALLSAGMMFTLCSIVLN